jgi:hypothetical protein
MFSRMVPPAIVPLNDPNHSRQIALVVGDARIAGVPTTLGVAAFQG